MLLALREMPARKNRSLASRASGGSIWRHTENHAFRTERNARLQKKWARWEERWSSACRAQPGCSRSGSLSLSRYLERDVKVIAFCYGRPRLMAFTLLLQ